MPVRKKLHLSDFSYTGSGTGYSMTLCTHGRENYFRNNELASEILKQLIFRIKNKEIVIYCYCIMPDHLHLLASFADEYKRSLQD